jgi:hypothetical protein
MTNDFNIAKQLLTQNGEITGITSGDSMKPLFRSQKDSAVIESITRPLVVNDVILYRKPATNELILHRIIKSNGENLIIRGDNVYFAEKNVPLEDIIGVLKGFYRDGKYFSCDKTLWYKLYVFYIRTSYPLRYLFVKGFRLLKRILRKIKNIFA